MDIANVLAEYFPNTRWELSGFEYENLRWLDSSNKPSEKELSDLWISLLEKREKSKIDFEKRNQEIENKLSALGLSVDDMKTILGV